MHTHGLQTKTHDQRSREKNWAALSSMLVAVLLTAAKLVAGLISGSLGLLSEALHSAMDLVGTVLSYAAVRISSRPPDATHPYGHAKVESLSALVAVGILSLTALGILREAFERMVGEHVVPQQNWLGIGVLVVAVAVDYSRSRYLRRVADEHGSAALAADAAHFATDLLGSLAVLFGLLIVTLGTFLGWPAQALGLVDASAGALVAFIILGVAAQLAVRAVHALTDRVPPGLVSEVVAAAEGTPNMIGSPAARVRFVGDQPYADVSINVARGLSLERSREVSQEVVSRVQTVLPHADVVVHTQPVASQSESAVEAATVTAARLGLGVHHVRAFDTPSGLRLDMHMEVPADLSLREAHEQADRLEATLTSELQSAAVQVHIEPRHEELYSLWEDAESRNVATRIAQVTGAIQGVHDIEVLKSDLGLVVTLHYYMPDTLPIATAHTRTAEIEQVVRDAIPEIYRVTVHPEPAFELHIP
ncbi:MAG TPA: cation diffusion facilitator family transporter [Chloroflexia bacterium]|jgi:cation diffusion facilitator family transporter